MAHNIFAVHQQHFKKKIKTMFKLLKLFFTWEHTQHPLWYLLFQLVVQLDWQPLVWKCYLMETVQTCTSTWSRCTSIFGAHFAVFVRIGRVLSSPCHVIFVLEVSPAPSPCCFNLLFNWTGSGWFDISAQGKPPKHVRARGDATWTCLTHALQCLCVWGVCCPTLATQLVIDNSTTDKNNGMGTWFFYHCIYDLHRQSVVHIDAQTNHFKVNWDPRNSKLCSLEVKIPQIMSEMSLRHVPKHHDFK